MFMIILYYINKITKKEYNFKIIAKYSYSFILLISFIEFHSYEVRHIRPMIGQVIENCLIRVEHERLPKKLRFIFFYVRDLDKKNKLKND